VSERERTVNPEVFDVCGGFLVMGGSSVETEYDWTQLGCPEDFILC
jgi:hypothetical protein